MAIEITEKAVEEVRRMMQKEGVQAAGLRVGVKGGGCSGLSYNLTFESQARTGDKVFEREEVKLFCDLKSYIYLNGTVLDYDSGLMGKGFVFMNPNAKKSCGCGSSFRPNADFSRSPHGLFRSVRLAPSAGNRFDNARENLSRSEPPVSPGLLHDSSGWRASASR